MIVTDPDCERGRFLPTVLDASEPLTPLSPFPLQPSVSRTFVRAASFEIPPATFWVPRAGPSGEESAKTALRDAP